MTSPKLLAEQYAFMHATDNDNQDVNGVIHENRKAGYLAGFAAALASEEVRELVAIVREEEDKLPRFENAYATALAAFDRLAKGK